MELNGTFKWIVIAVLKCNITTQELFNEGVHLNLAGVQKIFKSIWNYYQQHNINVSLKTNLALQPIQSF